MALRKGKGLSQEEKAVFDLNEAFFQNNFLAFLRTLTDPLDIEFAQLRRRYQSSFSGLSQHHCSFTHRFLNLTELEDFVEFKESPVLGVQLQVSENQLTVKITSEVLSDDLRMELENEVKQNCLRLKSLVKGMVFLDTHIEEVLLRAKKNCEYRAEQLQEEDKEEDFSEDESTPEYSDCEEEIHRQTIPKTGGGGSRAKPVEPKVQRKPATAGFVAKEKLEKFQITTSAMDLYGLGTIHLTHLNLQSHCRTCNFIDTFELVKHNQLLVARKTCNCGRQHNIELKPQIASLTSFILGHMTCSGLQYFMGMSLSINASCDSCLEDFQLNAVPQTCTIGNCPHCMNKYRFKIDQLNFSVADPPRTKPPTASKAELQPGSALPKQGTCKHYKQSFRWLRFPCCNKVFPCDDCHNHSADHTAVFATRMICGFCSREQNYSTTLPCSSCKADLTGKGKSNRRFWEGGKGCRDSAQLSKNDKRKYKNK